MRLEEILQLIEASETDEKPSLVDVPDLSESSIATLQTQSIDLDAPGKILQDIDVMLRHLEDGIPVSDVQQTIALESIDPTPGDTRFWSCSIVRLEDGLGIGNSIPI